ncbi:MAG: hypothetical protein KGL39_47360 [Patescibacteria group bacterium]|nr:hypothetical protein [Patescibacteria group bacterium]
MTPLRRAMLAYGRPPSCFRIGAPGQIEYMHALGTLAFNLAGDIHSYRTMAKLAASRDTLMPGYGRRLALAFIGCDPGPSVRLVWSNPAK